MFPDCNKLLKIIKITVVGENKSFLTYTEPEKEEDFEHNLLKTF